MAADGRDRAPKLTDAELVTLAVRQALGGDVSEARWLRSVRTHLHDLFPYLPRQAGYNKWLRAAFPLLRYFLRATGSRIDCLKVLWCTAVWCRCSLQCGWGACPACW